MKRILLILLSLFLLLSLFGCAKEPLSYPFVSLTAEEHSSLLNSIENPMKEISTNKAKGKINLEKAYLTEINEIMLESLEAQIYDASNDTVRDNTPVVIMFNETSFFPDTSGDYVYLFFILYRGSADLSISEITSANQENDTISITAINSFPTSHSSDDMVSSYGFILKIEKSSLSGNIEKLKIHIVDSN